MRVQIAEQAEAHAAIVDRLETAITELQEENLALQAKVRQLSGDSRVRLTTDANQLSIFGPQLTLGDDDPDDDDPTPGGGGDTKGGRSKRKGKQRRGARRLDTSRLPREERIIEKPESERICPVTGITLVPTGEKVLHEVAYTRGSCRLIVHRIISYGLPDDLAADRRVTEISADPPPRAIEGCLAHPSLLSWIIVQRFDHHLPYDRQRRILDHEGLPVTRQTLTEWTLQCGEALEPIAAAADPGGTGAADRRHTGAKPPIDQQARAILGHGQSRSSGRGVRVHPRARSRRHRAHHGRGLRRLACGRRLLGKSARGEAGPR